MDENTVLSSSQQTFSVEETLHRAIQTTLSMQHQAGYWSGRLDSNSTMEAEFLLLLHFLGVDNPLLKRKVANHILQQQREDGTWSLYYQGPGDLSTTIECYFALKLVGLSPDLPRLQKAKAFILAEGGVPQARIFTKIWLALFGQWPWEGIPVLLPEMMYLPARFPLSIYEFASWARATIVPLTIVMSERPLCSIPTQAALTEIFPANFHWDQAKMPRPTSLWSWKGFFWMIEKCLRCYEQLPWKPGRQRALRKALDWVISRQEEDGSWGGIQPPWVYSLIALKIQGYDLDHPIMKKGMDGFVSFFHETTDTLQVQACVSPVWDTAIMAVALQEAGMDSNHPAMQAACRWLISKQIHQTGDWQIKQPQLLPGGWPFEFANNYYPDIDDTAEVLMALSRATFSPDEEALRQQAISRGQQWILGMQNRDGGWAAFDKDNDKSFLTRFSFFDFGEVLDPSSVDVTAHVLEALSLMAYPLECDAVRRALHYIYHEQEADGSWFGRWGVNYIYGTGAVLSALAAVNEDMTQSSIRRAVAWLLACQNQNGGWGESCASYADATQRGTGPSTASQTAWAILGLIAAKEWRHAAVKRGIAYLCQTMNQHGSWDEPYYTGCGFPGYGVGKRTDAASQAAALSAGFMINYHYYRHYWPIIALGRYQQAKEKE